MCFYVGIVLPPSFFLHLVTFVLNKLPFSPQIILFLKRRPSIYSPNNGAVNLCVVFIPESKANER